MEPWFSVLRGAFSLYDRIQNAQLFEEAFYSGKNTDNQGSIPDSADAEMLMKLLQNPEMAALIKALAKNLQ